MLRIHCESNCFLTCRASYIITISICVETFSVTISVRGVTLSAQYTVELLQQLKSGFEPIIIWSKTQTKNSKSGKKSKFWLIDTSFQGVNRHFLLQFEDTTDRTSHTTYNATKAYIENYNVVIERRNLFAQPVKNVQRTYIC